MKQCEVDGCERRAKSKNLCGMHYARLKRTGITGGTDSLYNIDNQDKKCKIDGCERWSFGLNLCSMHYVRLRTHGDVGCADSKKRVNGTGNITKKGYQYVYKPNHPNAYKSGKVAMHVLVMSQILERPLRRGESVHHKNGIRSDNRPENLELMTHLHPSGQSIKEMVEFCKMYLSLYEKEITDI